MKLSMRNAALDVATGEWVVMLDPDDYWKVDSLFSQLFLSYDMVGVI